MNTLQIFNVLCVHTGAHTKKRILEVACGSGLHSLQLAKTMLQRGSVLVSMDISEEMVNMMKGFFESEHADFACIPSNKAFIEAKELKPIGDHSLEIDALL